MKVYLAGSAKSEHPSSPIHKWREQAAQLLQCETIDPFRGKDQSLKYTSNEIVHRDLRDIQSSDIVLAEMQLKNTNYIGTSMEIRYAAEMGIPVVIWCDDSVSKHYWIEYHTVNALPTIEECCAYIKSYWNV